MSSNRTILKGVLLLLVLGMVRLPAEDLTTRDGKVYRNYTVIGHDIGYLTIMYADGGGKIPLSNLPAELQTKYGYDPVKSDQFVKQDAEADRKARADVAQSEASRKAADDAQQQKLAEAQKKLAAQTRQAQSASPNATSPKPLTGFAAKFDDKLIILQNGVRQDFDTHALAGVKYWAFYYSASWCGPCRAFTPSLVSFYKSFKPTHPQFELIFVNQDQNEDDMMAYMKNDGMPWPAVRFEYIRGPEASRYTPKVIPYLVLVDADGKILSDSFEGAKYIGPEWVVDDIRSMVK